MSRLGGHQESALLINNDKWRTEYLEACRFAFATRILRQGWQRGRPGQAGARKAISYQ